MVQNAFRSRGGSRAGDPRPSSLTYRSHARIVYYHPLVLAAPALLRHPLTFQPFHLSRSRPHCHPLYCPPPLLPALRAVTGGMPMDANRTYALGLCPSWQRLIYSKGFRGWR
eukprot:1190326-Prorocentrum_minimum.AAC.2